MFYHAILGLLRDGRARHGYDLIREYRARSGRPVNPGNFYRECSKLLSQQLIALDANPPTADHRRIPYRITSAGSRDFDDWLLDPKPLPVSLDTWMVFADMLARGDRVRLLDEVRERLWMEGKALGQARDRMLRRIAKLQSGQQYQSAPVLMLRRIKQITADLELLQEFRRGLEQAPPSTVTISARASAVSDSITVPPLLQAESTRPGRKR